MLYILVYAGGVSNSRKKHKVFFEYPAGAIRFEGSPFLILGRKVYDCQHGVDRHAKDKSKNKQESVRDNMINKQKKTKPKNK